MKKYTYEEVRDFIYSFDRILDSTELLYELGKKFPSEDGENTVDKETIRLFVDNHFVGDLEVADPSNVKEYNAGKMLFIDRISEPLGYSVIESEATRGVKFTTGEE